MSACILKRVTAVEAHPDATATHLNVVRTADAQFVSMVLDSGAPRYAVGDLVVHIPDGAMLPNELLRRLDVWDDEAGRGRLKGSLGNRVKASNFKGFRSEGMLLPAAEVEGGPHAEGENVSAALGVTFAGG